MQQAHPAIFALQNGFNVTELQRICINPNYTQHFIPKKTGGNRKLWVPDAEVKKVQRVLLPYLHQQYDAKFPPTFQDYINSSHVCLPNLRKISVRQHAGLHAGSKFIFKTDLKDFYPSIQQKPLMDELMSSRFGIPEKMAEMISYIGTYKGQLVQGAPTSPVLANMFFWRMDMELLDYATNHAHHITYSRYADDIVFSSDKKFDIEATKEAIRNIINPFGLELNIKKTKAISSAHRQTITNIIVNEKPNVDRKYIRRIRAMLAQWSRDGITIAAARHIGKSPQNLDPWFRKYFIDKITGMIGWVGEIKGKNDPIYLKFINTLQYEMDRYNRFFHFDSQYPYTKEEMRKKIKKKGFLFDDFHRGTNIICRNCGLETNFDNYIQFRYRAPGSEASEISRHYQFQCQDCGELSYPDPSKVNNEMQTTEERCKCGGELRRDKALFCKACKIQREK
jgi:RNA-directed DNA polymerase